MRKYTFLFLTFALLALMLTVVRAVAPAQQEEKPMKKAARAYAGKVASVDSAQSRIIVNEEGNAELTLTIDGETKIIKGGKPITLAELKADDLVSGECEEGENGCKAISVNVTVTNSDSKQDELLL